MTRNSEFAARLARINAKNPPAPMRTEEPVETRLRAAPRPTLPMQIISATLGLCLMGGLVAFAWDDLAFLLPTEREGQSVTYLESALYDSMTEEEIERMNNDPRLAGKSIMQKMILSH